MVADRKVAAVPSFVKLFFDVGILPQLFRLDFAVPDKQFLA